jgi:hypothetical protein
VALINKYSFTHYHTYDLEPTEVGITIQYIEKKVTTHASTLNLKEFGRYVLVGTAYLDLNENIPSRGRLLIFEINVQ